MLPPSPHTKCIGKKLQWNKGSHVLLPSSSCAPQSSESGVEILTWGWYTRQRWVTPGYVHCWLKCSLSRIGFNTELMHGVGLCSFCSRIFFLGSFWQSFFWGHDISIINCCFLTTQKCWAWRSLTDWVWRPRQRSMLFRGAFATDRDCFPEATRTARITFQSLVRTGLAIDLEDCNSGVQITAWNSSLVVGCLPEASWFQW